jgi:hypothetical protein
MLNGAQGYAIPVKRKIIGPRTWRENHNLGLQYWSAFRKEIE